MPPRTTSRFRVELLEDRVTPSVTAAFDPGTQTLRVTLDAASDAVTVTGTVTGPDLLLSGTGFTDQTFTGVQSLVVVDAGANAGQSLTFRDNGGVIAIQGAITVNGIESVTVGTTGGLAAQSVGINGATTGIALQDDVTTTGPAGQVYGGPVTVGAGGATPVTAVTLDAGSAGGVEFTQAVNAAAFDADSLTVNAGGATKFDGPVGTTIRLQALTTDAPGTTVLATNVTTNGAQSYGDPVTVSGSFVTFTSAAAGVAFLQTLNAGTAGASGVQVNAPGLTRFQGAVGGSSALSGMGTDAAGSTEINANVTTTGSQTYTDAVTLSGAAITLASTGNGAVSLGAVSAGATSPALTVTTGGVTTFNGDVGSAAAPLVSLTTDAAGSTVIGSTTSPVVVTTSGDQKFNDAVRLNAPTATFTSGGGAVLFGGTLNGTTAGTTAVVVNTSGATTFGGVVGGTTTLASLTTDAAGTTVVGGSVTTTGAQTYADPVTVQPGTGVTAITLSNTAGSIAFGGAITPRPGRRRCRSSPGRART